MKLLILMSMIFLHIVDDYYLQGILAKMKQKSWRKENAPDKLYRYDYIVALIEHSFSWTFMTMLPITVCMIFYRDLLDAEVSWPAWCLFLLLNMVFHSIVDHAKANRRSINLVQDQLVHFLQIVATWLFFVV